MGRLAQQLNQEPSGGRLGKQINEKPQEEKKGVFQRAGEFIAKDLSGEKQETDSFFGNLFQSTLGSKGIAGIGQLPGRVLASRKTVDAIEPLAESKSTLASVTTQLIKKARSLPDSDPRKQQLLDTVRENQKAIGISDEEMENLAGSQTTAKEALGTTLNAELTLAGGGKGKIVANQGAKAFVSSASKKAVQNFITGAGYGTAQALIDNKEVQGVAVEAFKSGLIGSIVTTGAGAVSAGAQATLSKVPERLYNSALKVTRKLIEAGKSPSKALIAKGDFGTLGQLSRQAHSGIEQANKAIESKLSNVATPIEPKTIIEKATELLTKKFGKAYSPEQLRQAVLDSPISDLVEVVNGKVVPKQAINAADANKLRQQLDRILGERFFVSDTQGALGKEAIGALASQLRRTIQQVSGSTKEFSDLATYLKTQQLLNKALADTDRRFGLGLKDILIGGLFGGVTMNPYIGAAAIGAEKVLASPLSKTTAAVAIDRVNQAIQSAPADKAGRISKTAVLQIISQFVNNDNSTR